MANKKPLKKLISALLIISLAFNTIAAIVSDNDGAAFVTNKRTA